MNTGKAHGAALGDEEVAAVKKILGFDPDKKFEVRDEVIAHTRELVAARQGSPRKVATRISRRGRSANPSARHCWTG